MKELDDKLTLEETEQLCRLYMDCQLSVLEETELQYVLGKLPYSSPCIDEVRMLMGISKPEEAKKPFRFFRNKTAIGIAASLAILFGIGISLQIMQTGNDQVYVAAYSHGKRLSGDEATAATALAMARADSLMRFFSLAERDYMMKADNIISLTIDN